MARLRTGPIFTQDVMKGLTDVMDGEFPADMADNVLFQQKSNALQRFLQHGMSRFSIESLQNVLDSIVPTPVSSSQAGGETPRKMEVKSIDELRSVVKTVMTKRESGSIKASDADALKYMEHFFYAVYCMTQVKRFMDDIFSDLYYSYYQPENESRQPTKANSDLRSKTPNNNNNDEYSQFGISTLHQLTGSTHHKLRRTVTDMQGVLARWTDILTQGVPDTSSFEPESQQDLQLIRAVSRTQPILRLLPDTFAKLYKCVELSKQWWVLAHEVYPDLPFQRHPIEESGIMSEQSGVWSSNDSRMGPDVCMNGAVAVQETKDEIQEIHNEIEAVHEELEALSKREEKFGILMETYNKVGEDIDDKSLEQKQLRAERDRLSQSGNQDLKTREELARAEAKLRQVEGVLKLLEFQHTLLLQDYLIHLEIRPSIIRFQGEAMMKLQDAQATLEQRTCDLEKLEQNMGASPSSIHSSPNEVLGDEFLNSGDISDSSMGSTSIQIDSNYDRSATYRVNTSNTQHTEECILNVNKQTNIKPVPVHRFVEGSKISPNVSSAQNETNLANKRLLLQKSNSKRQVVNQNSVAKHDDTTFEASSIAKETLNEHVNQQKKLRSGIVNDSKNKAQNNSTIKPSERSSTKTTNSPEVSKRTDQQIPHINDKKYVGRSRDEESLPKRKVANTNSSEQGKQSGENLRSSEQGKQPRENLHSRKTSLESSKSNNNETKPLEPQAPVSEGLKNRPLRNRSGSDSAVPTKTNNDKAKLQRKFSTAKIEESVATKTKNPNGLNKESHSKRAHENHTKRSS